MTETNLSDLLATSPREAARAFTPELTALVNDPLYSEVWPTSDSRPGTGAW